MKSVVIAADEPKLRREIASLREANEDLRLSAVRWKAMYECAARRCAELEAQLKRSNSERRFLIELAGRQTMKSANLIVVSTFRSTADAQVAKGVLDEAGIDSMIRSDNGGGMYPALAGADLLVRAEDAEKANELLGDAIPDAPS